VDTASIPPHDGVMLKSKHVKFCQIEKDPRVLFNLDKYLFFKAKQSAAEKDYQQQEEE
jgi:hypothetical protein